MAAKKGEVTRLGDRIRIAREEKGWSQHELAAATGSSQSTVDRLERGQTETSRHLAKILIALGIEEQAQSRVPVVGYVGGGQTVFAIDDHAKGNGLDEIEAPAGLANAIALIVRGDSMEPKYEDGDIVVVDKVLLDITSLLGRVCYVKLTDGRCYLKRLAAGSRSGRYSLLSSNAPTIHDVVIEHAYPLAWVKPRR